MTDVGPSLAPLGKCEKGSGWESMNVQKQHSVDKSFDLSFQQSFTDVELLNAHFQPGIHSIHPKLPSSYALR